MITFDDMIKNLRKEQEHIDYEPNLKEICEKYSEDNLLFYETGNRMSGPGGLFLLRKDNISKIIYVDEEDELLYEHFPIAMNLDYKYDTDYDNEKYNHVFTGFGGKLFIDKKIYDDFYNKADELVHKYEMMADDNYIDENFMHSYWITIANDILK